MTFAAKDASGTTQNLETPNANGRAAAASSRPVVLSTEDAAKVPSLGQAAMAASTPVTIASNQTNVPAKVLLAGGTARQLTTTASSANTALTAGIKAISIYARNSDARFAIGNTSQTASSTTHFIASGERLDLDVSGYATPNIAIIYGPTAAAAILEISELS